MQFGKKFKCNKCNSKFSEYEELTNHAKLEHHATIVKCSRCGKEFIHEADRLHHLRNEHKKEIRKRVHKSEHRHENKDPSPQDEIDRHMRKFSDNF